MASDATLGFDCSGGWCAVAVVTDGVCRAMRTHEGATGQAEILMPMAEAVLADAGMTWGDLVQIGVGVGPGNFTGLRIAVAAARGLALALGVPAVGVPLAQARRLGLPGDVWVLERGPAGQVIVTAPAAAPVLVPEQAVAAHVGAAPVTGSAAPAGCTGTLWPAAVPLAEAVARIAATDRTGAPPAPLYLRPPDAAPSREAVPVLLD
ncbi:tRNA (adenosine(37)-N6)-threonylcarbamoyltransferase complex dimerization subunit type 1 TsaB [Rhodobaculum claviforme]|uniref:tRNA (Adenosine(37)-N6)-threonylcarbamoyltransferase complex dimerization subunit type 1 TsaB n=1 Tax=Rhodobaculum claviforme TaxID=1549854 RepID=A0A934TKH1_9RHOB|nr:tRNA (adenosine(37)-N6)-threonylcarbamoyltransferase complex dimerization subunit type 1 TsaB [Rhodobaculum claviforme]MBK5927186.1 tRNA (adenosine(37)-N6)-threonylcarbamoyltransferase complex dimerization subunit type 1 TsaB [Rhodobaculum claviforme]